MSIEHSLIERSRQQGDGEAFSRLVQMHQGKLRSFLLRLCQNYDLCDDLAQDTFIQAFRKLHSYSGEGHFGAWLFRIGYHCFLQHRRRDSRRQEINEELRIHFEVLESAFEEIDLVQMDLEQALSALQISERAALSLCHSYGFSHSEAAAILEIPVGTVKTHIMQGKENLRRLLTDSESGRKIG